MFPGDTETATETVTFFFNLMFQSRKLNEIKEIKLYISNPVNSAVKYIILKSIVYKMLRKRC